MSMSKRYSRQEVEMAILASDWVFEELGSGRNRQLNELFDYEGPAELRWRMPDIGTWLLSTFEGLGDEFFTQRTGLINFADKVGAIMETIDWSVKQLGGRLSLPAVEEVRAEIDRRYPKSPGV